MYGVLSVHMSVGADAAHLVSALLVDESLQAVSRIATPSPCAHVVARFDRALPGGVDVHVLGAQCEVRRKQIGAGHRAILLQLRPGTVRAIAGAAPGELIGKVVAIEDMWGAEAATRLRGRLAAAADANDAAALLQAAVVERASTSQYVRAATPWLALAIERLQASGVADAARATGLSERQLRREFHDALGLPPKAVARLERFARALRAAQSAGAPTWVTIAADAGYYDQAHMIADFNAIAGVAPRVLLAELRLAAPVGCSGLSHPSPPAAPAMPPPPARRTRRR